MTADIGCQLVLLARLRPSLLQAVGVLDKRLSGRVRGQHGSCWSSCSGNLRPRCACHRFCVGTISSFCSLGEGSCRKVLCRASVTLHSGLYVNRWQPAPSISTARPAAHHRRRLRKSKIRHPVTNGPDRLGKNVSGNREPPLFPWPVGSHIH